VLTRLRQSVQGKRPGLWPDKWILQHDNSSANDALRVCKESISKATAAASAQVSKFCFHRAIPGIKLLQHVYIYIYIYIYTHTQITVLF
jgi:hypothetical protein